MNFLSLDIRDDRDAVRELIRQRRWKMPVGYDRDGAVASLYRVGGCPTFAYVFPGGTLQNAGIGDLGERELSERVERLLRASARAESGGDDANGPRRGARADVASGAAEAG